MREKFLGRRMPVLTESKEGGTFGHTSNFLPVYLEEDFPPNTIVEVLLVENRPDGFLGTVCR
jgi:hypothetical protein